MLGLSVCHHFFNFVALMPEEVLSNDTCSVISLEVWFLTDTTRLFPFTTEQEERIKLYSI